MELLRDAIAGFKKWESGQSKNTTFRWGVPFMDAGVGRAVPGSLIVIGGRPGAGKSFFGLLMQSSTQVPTLYFSLEDTSHEVARRGLPISDKRQSAIMLSTPVRPRLSIIERDIRAAFETGHNPQLVVIDYLQLVQYDGDVQAWNKSDQIGNILAEVKGLARELDFVPVVNCQLRRPDRGEEEKAPTIFDLRDSSNIENSAEVIVLLHDKGDRVAATVAKNKSGRRGAAATYARSDNGFLVPAPDDEDDDIFGDEKH